MGCAPEDIMDQGQRIILLLSALLVMASSFFSGHTTSGGLMAGACYPESSLSVLVRLKGKAITSGVYAVPEGSTVASVLSSQHITSGVGAADTAFLRTRLRSGDVLDLAGEGHAIGIARMKATEQMVLGIPLDPDRMDFEDWSAVPGIGPRMAQRIIDDRQSYGSFHSIEGVLRVPGIGNRKFADMKKYF
jgi:competence protein ComEA